MLALTEVPKDLKAGQKADYEESWRIYENYSSECTDSYIFSIETKFNISVDQLETPIDDLNVRSLEDAHIKNTLQFLLEMPDKDSKLTLCAMPVGLIGKPTSWEAIKDDKFYMINGQDSVAASKQMRVMG